MNYKELFNKMAFLLSSPSRFWEKEATEGQGSRMMSEYVYPLIGLCGLSEFIGTFIGRDVSTEFFSVGFDPLLCHCGIVVWWFFCCNLSAG